jgi:hypothetical protein
MVSCPPFYVSWNWRKLSNMNTIVAKPKHRNKKIVETKTTLINFVLDETGSMESCRDATISGFNEYLQGLKKRKENILFSLTKFDSRKINVVYNCEPIKNIKPLNRDTYIPGEMTPLYDAIAKTVRETEQKIKDFEDISVLTVILTDGEENSSKEYSRQNVFDLIKNKECQGWTFVYLGANQDAWKVGQGLGFCQGNTMTYHPRHMHKVYCGLVNNTANYLMGSSLQTSNFNIDRSGEDKGSAD